MNNKYTLRFKDSNVENKYLNWQRESYKEIYIVFWIVLNAAALINLINDSIINNGLRAENLLFLLLALFYPAILGFLKGNLKSMRTCILSVSAVFTFCYPWEVLLKNNSTLSPNYTYFIGAILEMLLTIFLGCLPFFINRLLIILVYNIYLSYRVLSHETYESNNYTPIILMLFKILVSVHYQYFGLNREKTIFFQNENVLEKLNKYEMLITQVMPSPFLLLQKDLLNSEKILSVNKAAKKFFKSEDQSKIYETLEKGNLTENKTQHFDWMGVTEHNSSISLIKQILVDVNRKESLEDSEFHTLHSVLKVPDVKYVDVRFGYIKMDMLGPDIIFIIFEDLTDMRLASDLQALNAKKDGILATVSHDLRTPLNGLLGMVDLALGKLQDLSNPQENGLKLTSVKSSSSSSKLQKTSTKLIRKHLNVALRSGRLLLHMINDILDFSQIAAGKLRLNLEPVDTEFILKNVCSLIRFQAKQKGLKLIIENKLGKGRDRVLADPNRIQQILLNLLGNALKFTEKGYLKIIVERSQGKSEITNEMKAEPANNLKLAPEDRMKPGSNSNLKPGPNSNLKPEVYSHLKPEPNSKSVHKNEVKPELTNELIALISVIDTGPGISEQDIPKLFKMFGKLDSSTPANKTGVGLGLAISQNLATLMMDGREGGIKVESKLGIGTTFYFPLKLILGKTEENFEEIDERGDQVKHSDSSASLSRTNELNSDSGSDIPQHKNSVLFGTIVSINQKEKWVLVVDDDPINLMVAKNYLDLFGLKYMAANNGKDALQMIEFCKSEKVYFDLILMDCNMPIMDGFEAAREIRKMENEFPITIIACTANVEPSDIQRCYDSGMDYYLSKPLHKMSLRAVIEKFLNIEIQI